MNTPKKWNYNCAHAWLTLFHTYNTKASPYYIENSHCNYCNSELRLLTMNLSDYIRPAEHRCGVPLHVAVPKPIPMSWDNVCWSGCGQHCSWSCWVRKRQHAIWRLQTRISHMLSKKEKYYQLKFFWCLTPIIKNTSKNTYRRFSKNSMLQNIFVSIEALYILKYLS